MHDIVQSVRDIFLNKSTPVFKKLTFQWQGTDEGNIDTNLQKPAKRTVRN
jgi:hypothetical protein